ncbi:3-deoxy-manno-octulosonate cytidylyltransferase [Lampropedia puyangensis]|uniref:3-deoxy-manno-octulosonate cytidylyltransferase n=1 Tax=Lampropedia puyangensis TaxID=1330072 RepID=A0A4S8FDZ0_9BURK|nr:3-deoxy-manno-octulosonate cytidylyltransferase [Lampropedia puyangensis]THU04102.1 3-deoxy-manno-octulosonate cytidylyltransferase [Lampropedia puyangensis]
MSQQTPFTVLIPARMSSSRLPNKPLADIGGLPMVVRVAKQAQQSQASAVIVATDDARIHAACDRHHIACARTRADHPSGSDRLAEAAEQLALADDAIVVNVQGDEPFIPPDLINATAHVLAQHSHAVMGTAAHPIEDEVDFLNPNVVKVVLNAAGTAQYFSRAPVPYFRDAIPQPLSQSNLFAGSNRLHRPLRHIGIYSYRAGFLKQFPKLSVAPTESNESLEQLRVLWHGYAIAVHLAHQAPPAGVDTPEDLARVQAYAAQC